MFETPVWRHLSSLKACQIVATITAILKLEAVSTSFALWESSSKIISKCPSSIGDSLHYGREDAYTHGDNQLLIQGEGSTNYHCALIPMCRSGRRIHKSPLLFDTNGLLIFLFYNYWWLKMHTPLATSTHATCREGWIHALLLNARVCMRGAQCFIVLFPYARPSYSRHVFCLASI